MALKYKRKLAILSNPPTLPGTWMKLISRLKVNGYTYTEQLIGYRQLNLE